MDIFRKSLAPISEAAWDEINEQAKITLTTFLSARKFVDVEGPKGLDFSAVNLGRLSIEPDHEKDDVKFGMRKVLPLIETRIPFELNIWELDDAARGAEDIDLGPLEDAAEKIAKFEDNAIYNGFKKAAIAGLKEVSEHKIMTCPKDAEEALCSIPEGIRILKESAIDGPYALVVNPAKWQEIAAYAKGYPLRRQIEEMLDGKLVFSPNIDGMYLVSQRGGDMILTIGQDMTIGYDGHDSKKVKLYLMESFTFHITDPAAFIVFG
ncbi:MAG: family 1 encapsulin nanocompartment shell protein [Candidatus Zixiibacteriota bacterium]